MKLQEGPPGPGGNRYNNGVAKWYDPVAAEHGSASQVEGLAEGRNTRAVDGLATASSKMEEFNRSR